MVKLSSLLPLALPFVFVALYHNIKFTASLTAGLSSMGRPRMPLIGAGRRRGMAAFVPPMDEAFVSPPVRELLLRCFVRDAARRPSAATLLREEASLLGPAVDDAEDGGLDRDGAGAAAAEQADADERAAP